MVDRSHVTIDTALAALREAMVQGRLFPDIVHWIAHNPELTASYVAQLSQYPLDLRFVNVLDVLRGDHIAYDELRRYADPALRGSLGISRRDEISEHLRTCSICHAISQSSISVREAVAPVLPPAAEHLQGQEGYRADIEGPVVTTDSIPLGMALLIVPRDDIEDN